MDNTTPNTTTQLQALESTMGRDFIENLFEDFINTEAFASLASTQTYWLVPTRVSVTRSSAYLCKATSICLLPLKTQMCNGEFRNTTQPQGL